MRTGTDNHQMDTSTIDSYRPMKVLGLVIGGLILIAFVIWASVIGYNRQADLTNDGSPTTGNRSDVPSESAVSPDGSMTNQQPNGVTNQQPDNTTDNSGVNNYTNERNNTGGLNNQGDSSNDGRDDSQEQDTTRR